MPIVSDCVLSARPDGIDFARECTRTGKKKAIIGHNNNAHILALLRLGGGPEKRDD
jgi:hypothetical protein